MKEIKLHGKFFFRVIQGKKSSTIRMGRKTGTGPSDLINVGTGCKLRVIVERLEYLEYRDLQPVHAKKDGFERLIDLKLALQSIYGEIDPSQIMTVIHFK